LKQRYAKEIEIHQKQVGGKMAKRASKPAGKPTKPHKLTCLDVAFKNNDQLKTNTALQTEAAKIEFKAI
jgi:hypothetical protein